MNSENTENNNILVFPGAKIEHGLQNEVLSKNLEGLTKLEAEEVSLEFSHETAKEEDLAYNFAFKNKATADIENLYYRPRISFDFTLPTEIQTALKNLEVQFNQCDYLIRKIAYYSR